MTVLRNVRILDLELSASVGEPVDVEFSDTITAILSAGSAASAPGSKQIAVMGFPTESGVAGPEDAERFLDWRVENGVDLIKIIIEDPDATDMPALDIPTLQAIVEGARKRAPSSPSAW